MDFVYSFVVSSLMKQNETLLEKRKGRKKYSNAENDMILYKCVPLKNHIMFCMRNFTIYIMCAEMTANDEGGKLTCAIVGVTIVEKIGWNNKRTGS